MTTNFTLFIYSSSRQHVRIQPFNEISENRKGFTLIMKFLRSFQTTTIRDRKVKLQLFIAQPGREVARRIVGTLVPRVHLTLVHGLQIIVEKCWLVAL